MQLYHQNSSKSLFEEQHTMNELSKMGNLSVRKDSEITR